MIVGPSAAGGMSDLVAHHHHMSGFAAHHHHHHMGLGGMMAAGMVSFVNIFQIKKKSLKIIIFKSFNYLVNQ